MPLNVTLAPCVEGLGEIDVICAVGGVFAPPTSERQIASAQVEAEPIALILTTAVDPKLYVPSRFHYPPFVCWLTPTVLVPAVCVMSIGALAGRLES
mgnify:CR=1 FL=1